MPAHPEKIIGDSTYRVRPLGGEDSKRVHYALARAVLSGLSSERGVDLGILLEQAKGFKVDFIGAFTSLPYEEFDAICRLFAGYTTVTFPDGDHPKKTARLPDVYESQLGGARQWHLLPWLAFCLEVNFGDGFFSAVRERLAQAKEKSQSRSPEGKTGSSGDSTSPPS